MSDPVDNPILPLKSKAMATKIFVVAGRKRKSPFDGFSVTSERHVVDDDIIRMKKPIAIQNLEY